MDHEAARIVLPDAVTIRRAGPDDLLAIQLFLSRAYGPLAPYKAERRWRWQFAQNPYFLSDDGLSPVWLAVQGREVVGQIAVQAGMFKIGAELCAGGWIVDVMILPAFRGRRLGHRLYRAVSHQVPLLLMLTMAPATRRMAVHGGAVTLNQAEQYSRWTHFLPQDVRRYLLARADGRRRLLATTQVLCDIFQAHHIIAAAANIYLGQRRLPGAASRPGLTIVETDGFGPETDAFWCRIAPGYEAIQVRDSRYLNWRYRRCPDLHYRCFVAASGSGIVGYSVLRHTEAVEKRQGIIAELLVERGDVETYRALVMHAIALFGRDVASLECVTSQPEEAELLRDLGFIRTRSTAATGSSESKLLSAAFESTRENWYFTKGDHDWDQIHLG